MIDIQEEIQGSIESALFEDIGTGDVTTLGTIPKDATGTGIIKTKSSGVIAGLDVAGQVFDTIDPEIQFKRFKNDGDHVSDGEIIAEVSGSMRSILVGERTALNFIQRMSGIATHTASLVDATAHTNCKILDTRKTVPGLRAIDKLAVETGGGINHRSGLYDMVLIKDNHIEISSGITAAVESVREYMTRNLEKNLPIEVEVKNIAELKEALAINVDRIMLDNMAVETIREAVELTAGKIPLEVSGNVNFDNIREKAETGVDYISVGAITHSVMAMDISLLVKSN